MRKLLNIALLSLCCMLCLTSFTEAGRRSSVNEIQAMESYSVDLDGEKIQRIELTMSKGNVNYRLLKEGMLDRQILIEIDQTTSRAVEPLLTVNSGGVSAVIAHDTDEKTRLRIKLNHSVASSAYKVYTMPAERRTRKPERLIIDIYPTVEKNEYHMTRLDGHVIVIDPGHGGSDAGAIGPRGLKEKEVAFSVSQKLRSILGNAGARVIMTRETDTDVYGSDASNSQELGARTNIANRTPNAELFLSIHCNGFQSPAAHGMETFYFTGSYGGERFASLLNQELEAAGGLKNRGVKSANFYVLKHTKMPASLVELAFITNYEEEALLGDEDYQQRLAEGLAKGIGRYFSGE